MADEASTTGLCEICKIPTEKKCTACKIVFYCTIEHQQEHWKEHRNNCRHFEISKSKELGRHLKASRDIDVDDIIFTELPLVVGPKPQKNSDGPIPCVGCCRLLYNPSCHRCPDCHWPVCKPDCQGLTIPAYHGFECKILRLRSLTEANSFYDYYRFDILIALRALYLKKYKPNKWEKLITLEDHFEQRGKGTDIYKSIDEKVSYLEEHYLKPLKNYEQEINQTILSDVPSELIHRIYGILDVNATEISDEVDAMVLYPTASLLEHNCIPNVIQSIDEKNGFEITFRAALPIHKGEHITSMYTHILWDTSARRDHLKQTKYFICTCQRCKDPTELGTYLSALKCFGTGQDTCGGMQLPVNPTDEDCTWACQKCGLKLPDKDVVKFVNHLNEQVNKVMTGKPKIKDLEDVIEKLSNFIHPNHYLMYTVKHSLVQLYGNEGDIEISNNLLEEKLKILQELIDITTKIDPGSARLSIYLAVLLNEQLISKFKLLSRRYTEDQKNTFSNECQEIRTILKDTKHILRHEKNNSSGSKLFEVICQHEEMFRNWLAENSME